VDALSRLERALVECPEVRGHYYPAQSTCAWCDLESKLPFRAFHREQALPTITPEQIDALWKTVASIEPPPPPPSLPNISFGGSNISILSFSRYLFLLLGIVIGIQQTIPVAVLVVSLTFVMFFVGRASPGKRQAIQNAEEFLKYVVSKWNEGCSNEAFSDVDTRLAELRAQLVELVQPGRRQQEIIDAAREQYGRLRFLAQFRIDEALAEEGGGKHTMTLATKGVHTAADLDRQTVNPGELLPSDVSQQLYDWYQQRVSLFSFDGDAPISAEEREHAQLALYQRQQALMGQLHEGAQNLLDARASILKKRADQKALLDEACRSLAAARSAEQDGITGKESRNLSWYRFIATTNVHACPGVLLRAALSVMCLLAAGHLRYFDPAQGIAFEDRGFTREVIALVCLAGALAIWAMVAGYTCFKSRRDAADGERQQ
jgi:hypothetical protein